jgi:(aminoalkyl)phosphonate N-acetyltransferase
MKNVFIRRARSEEYQRIADMNGQVYEAVTAFDEFLDMSRPKKASFYKDWKKTCADPKRCVLVADIQGKIVGYLSGKESPMVWRNARIGEIENMGVIPEYRNQSIGSQLVNEFRKWCKEHKIDRLFVTTYWKGEKAKDFYRKQGLEPIDISFEGKV